MFRKENALYYLQDGSWAGRLSINHVHLERSKFTRTNCCADAKKHAEEWSRMIHRGSLVLPEDLSIFMVSVCFVTPTSFGHRHARQDTRSNKIVYYEQQIGKHVFRNHQEQFDSAKWKITGHVYDCKAKKAQYVEYSRKGKPGMTEEEIHLDCMEWVDMMCSTYQVVDFEKREKCEGEFIRNQRKVRADPSEYTRTVGMHSVHGKVASTSKPDSPVISNSGSKYEHIFKIGRLLCALDFDFTLEGLEHEMEVCLWSSFNRSEFALSSLQSL